MGVRTLGKNELWPWNPFLPGIVTLGPQPKKDMGEVTEGETGTHTQTALQP